MPHRFIRRATLALLLPALSLAAAQGAANDPSAAVMDGVAIISEGQGVSLRWSLPGGAFPDGGFVVERTAPDGSTASFAVASPRPWEDLVAGAEDGAPVLTEEAYRAVGELFSAESVRDSGADDTGLAVLRALYTLQIAVNPDLAEALGLLFHDDGVSMGGRYSYAVHSGTGELLGTAAITVGSTPPLASPSGLLATPTPAGIELIWDRPAEEDLVFAYRIWAGAPGAEPTLLTPDWLTPPAPADEYDGEPFEEPYWFRDEGRAPGESVQYTLEGRDLFGRVTPLSEPVLAVMPDPQGLPQPLVVDSVTGDRTITLRWGVEPDERIVALGVLRSHDLSVAPELVSPLLDPSATTWTDEGLLGGEDYHYAVAAFDANGAATVGPIWTQRAVNPNGPDAVTALALEPTAEALLLSWHAPPQVDVGRYQVYGGRPGQAFDEMTLLGETVLTTYSAPIPANTLFDVAYRVRAVNTSDVAGAVSEEVSGRPLDLTAPSAPLWAAVSGEEERIALSWLLDLDPDLSHVRLLRAAGEDELAVLVEDIAPTTTSYSDSDVVAGTVYRYALQAVDAAGNESPLGEVAQAAAWSLAPAAPVSGLNAELLEDGGVRLSWDQGGEAGAGSWVVSKLVGDDWLEISDLLSTPEFVDARGQAGDRYQVRGYSSTGQPGEATQVAVDAVE